MKLMAILWLGLIAVANPSFASTISGYRVIEKTNAQASTMKERITKDRDKEIEARQTTAEDKIQAITQSAESEVAKVPPYYYNAWGYRMPNPDYESTVASIRIDAQKEVYVINRDLAAIIKIVNATYQEKLNAIDESTANVDTQIRPGTSDIQMTPVGSNLYVKNYVNYATDPPKKTVVEGLKARQETLANKQTKKISN